jgi:hypothetical protein
MALVEGGKPPMKARAKAWVDKTLIRWGMSKKARRVTYHYAGLFYEQLIAMVPITLLQVNRSRDDISMQPRMIDYVTYPAAPS